MITVAQLSRSIARHLDVDDTTNLPVEAAADVLMAINAGLQRFYDDAPAYLSRLAISRTLRAPTRISLNFTAQYSTQLQGAPFDAAWFGCGLLFDGINPINEIRGVSNVLDEWISPNLSAQATVLHDVVSLPVTIKRVTSDVRMYRSDWDQPRALTRNEAFLGMRRDQSPSIPAIDDCPLYYRIDSCDFAADGARSSLLRVFPAPQADLIVRFDAEIAAASVSMADMVNGASVPVADQWTGMLTRLCEDELTYSPLWKDDKTKSAIRASAQDVIATRITKIPHDQGVPNNAVGTPWGY